MDPNATLDKIRKLARRLQGDASFGADPDPIDVRDLEDAVQALDEWISKGGFLPDSWEIAQKRAIGE